MSEAQITKRLQELWIEGKQSGAAKPADLGEVHQDALQRLKKQPR